MKNLKFLTVVLTLLVMLFGVEAKAQYKLELIKPCMKLVRCSKLDSAQHDLETMLIQVKELETYKAIVKDKDLQLHDFNEFNNQLQNTNKSQEKKIIILEDKVKRRGKKIIILGVALLAKFFIR